MTVPAMELINGPDSEVEGAPGDFFSGFVSPRWYNTSSIMEARVDDFLVAGKKRRLDTRAITEAFSTSDFTLGLFASIDTETLAQYQELASVWRQYTDVTTVNDFRPKRLVERWARQIGLKLVPELTEYPTGLAGAREQYWINVVKYGLRDAISFEANINNEAIDELEAIPGKYSRAAGETETINALANLLAIDPKTNLANGANTNFWKNYTTGPYAGVNNSPDNKDLTAENIDLILSQMATRKNPRSGRQIAQPALTIVIPRALEWQMKKIQALREIRVTNQDNSVSVYDNYLATIDYVMDPMLDSINVHSKAAKTWMILPKPGQSRPASFAAFLRGYEIPDLRVKADTGRRIGGGDIDPREGSFDIDDIQYRVRHILGHQTGDPTFTYFSYGS